MVKFCAVEIRFTVGKHPQLFCYICSVSIALRIARQLAEGMSFLHASEQVHGHLKSKNVILDSDMNVKIGDIGIRKIKSFMEVMLLRRMASAWSAPEVLEGKPATKKSDVYSFAIICSEMLTRAKPFGGRSLPDIHRIVVQQSGRPRLPEASAPFEFLELIARCWSPDPTIRPDFDEIIDVLSQIVPDASSPPLSPLLNETHPVSLNIFPVLSSSPSTANT
jgi:serine/threonine protein kinase